MYVHNILCLNKIVIRFGKSASFTHPIFNYFKIYKNTGNGTNQYRLHHPNTLESKHNMQKQALAAAKKAKGGKEN